MDDECEHCSGSSDHGARRTMKAPSFRDFVHHVRARTRSSASTSASAGGLDGPSSASGVWQNPREAYAGHNYLVRAKAAGCG